MSAVRKSEMWSNDEYEFQAIENVAERRLWSRVLQLAIEDATDSQRSVRRTEAREWIFSEATEELSFRWICDEVLELRVVDEIRAIVKERIRLTPGQLPLELLY